MNKKNKKLLEPLSEIGGELLLDSQLSEGLLKEIPVISTIWAAYKTGKSLQEHLYLRKLKLFVENITDINDDYQEFLRNAEVDEESFSNSLLLILDKIEDERKAVLIAKAFNVYVKEKFSFETFNKILLIINRGFCDDLLKIRVFEENEIVLTSNRYIESESLEELFSCGLLTNAGFNGGIVGDDSAGTRYCLNKYGEIFLRIVKEMN